MHSLRAPRRALLVDSDEQCLRILTRLATFHGFTSYVARNLQEGTRLAESQTPDIAFVDIHLPDGDGSPLIATLAAKPELLVVATSSAHSVEAAVRAVRQGAYEYLTKPFDEYRLRNLFNRALQQIKPASVHARRERSAARWESGETTQDESLQIQVGTSISDAERRLILATLRYCGGNKPRAATMLGVSLKTLYNRLNAYKRT